LFAVELLALPLALLEVLMVIETGDSVKKKSVANLRETDANVNFE
jgi:hypothetical protein